MECVDFQPKRRRRHRPQVLTLAMAQDYNDCVKQHDTKNTYALFLFLRFSGELKVNTLAAFRLKMVGPFSCFPSIKWQLHIRDDTTGFLSSLLQHITNIGSDQQNNYLCQHYGTIFLKSVFTMKEINPLHHSFINGHTLQSHCPQIGLTRCF